MKLYTTKVAPNPKRVHIFLAEKGIDIDCVEIDLGKSENLEADFVKINPLARVPVLELDDGSHIAESIAICRYFEEQQPEPTLFGASQKDKAVVEMWNRRMESEILANASMCFRHTHPYWKGRIPQVHEFGELCRKNIMDRMTWLDGELAEREYISGDRFTVADITAFVGFQIGRVPKIRIGEDMTNLQRWFDGVSSRSSSQG